MKDDLFTSRRDFLKLGTTALTGAALISSGACSSRSEEASSKKGKLVYRTLGRTGLKLPVVSMGSAHAIDLAHTALDPHSVLAFGPRQWGVQFHPEFDRAIMQGYIEARREVLMEEGFDPDAMVAGAIETPAATQVLARFARRIEDR